MLGFVKQQAASVGAAVVRLLDAEWQELQQELRNSQSEAKHASVRFGAASALLLLGAGALVYSAIVGLSGVLPDWAAGLVVGVLLLIAGGIAWWAAQQRLAKIEPPGTTVKRRVDEHLSFWRGEFEGVALGDGRETAGRSPRAEDPRADSSRSLESDDLGSDDPESDRERIAWKEGRQDFDDIPDQSW